MSKLTVHKLVFNLTHYDNMMFINIDSFDFEYLGVKVSGCNTIYKKTLYINDEKFDQETFLMIAQINELLKKLEMIRPVCVLNIASNEMIFETFTLPKLSQTESMKSLDVELGKLYPNYESKYVYQFTKLISDGVNNKYNVALFDLDLYKKILSWFKDLKVTLLSATVNESALRRVLVKTTVFKKKRGSIFINMKENDTQIVANDSRNIDGSVVIKEGYSGFEYAIEAIIRREKANYPDEEVTLDSLIEKYNNDEIEDLIKKIYKNLMIEIKKVVGNLFLKQNVFKVYFNVENYDDKIIGPTLTRLLNIRFSKLNYVKPSVLVHLSSYGALMRHSKSSDYSYPLKVK